MDSKITIPKSVCNDDVVDYIASRYSITPQQVINQFMCQEGILRYPQGDGDKTISFEENEGVYAILNTDINLGFKNLSHFSKVYKEAFGVAPTVHVR